MLVMTLLVISNGYCIANNINGIYAEVVDFKINVNRENKRIQNKILVVDDMTYVSLREVANLLDCTVHWDAENNNIDIVSDVQYEKSLFPFEDENGYCGFKDKDGKVRITPQYFSAMEFQEGVSIVRSSDGKTGLSFINESGEEYIKFPINYYQASSGFSEGLTVIYFNDTLDHRVADGEKTYIYVDKAGNQVIDREFVYARNFSEGYAVVAESEGKWENSWIRIYRYIDKTGEYASDERFLEAGSFTNGFAKVTNMSGEKGRIDKSFNFYPNEN